MALKNRQKRVLGTLRKLGGTATTKEIAKKVGLSVNGVAQTLGALNDRFVLLLGGRGGNILWRLLE